MTSASQPTSTFTPDQFKTYFSNANNRPANSSNQALCDTVHPVGVAVGGNGQYGYKDDYIPHHEPFQYYVSTANPHHLAPASLAAIGTDTQSYVAGVPQFNTANHQYDMSDFNALLGAISHGFLSPDHLPAVSFLKAPGYEDGHAAYSDPYDEQQFVTSEINALEETPDWSSTAVIVTYDDSDGCYDHVYSGVHNPSNTSGVASPPGPQDFLTGSGLCGTGTPLAGQNGRCGYGPRLPLLVISPWAKRGAVDNTLTDFSSIDKFVEDNWGLPRIPGSFDSIAGSLNSMFDFHGPGNPKLFLDPVTGQPAGPEGRRPARPLGRLSRTPPASVKGRLRAALHVLVPRCSSQSGSQRRKPPRKAFSFSPRRQPSGSSSRSSTPPPPSTMSSGCIAAERCATAA